MIVVFALFVGTYICACCKVTYIERLLFIGRRHGLIFHLLLVISPCRRCTGKGRSTECRRDDTTDEAPATVIRRRRSCHQWRAAALQRKGGGALQEAQSHNSGGADGGGGLHGGKLRAVAAVRQYRARAEGRTSSHHGKKQYLRTTFFLQHGYHDDILAEWSKAPDLGSGLSWRRFESCRCHFDFAFLLLHLYYASPVHGLPFDPIRSSDSQASGS